MIDLMRTAKGMSPVVTKLFKEIQAWAVKHNVNPSGAPFLRYYVIDMTGDMDIYESYLIDPKVEPRRKKWEVEVAIKLVDT